MDIPLLLMDGRIFQIKRVRSYRLADVVVVLGSERRVVGRVSLG